MNVTLFFEENITLDEVTEIVQTVKMKSLYFLYWCSMLVFLSDSVCFILERVVHSVESVLSRVLRVVLR